MWTRLQFGVDQGLGRAFDRGLSFALVLGGMPASANTPQTATDQPIVEPLFSQKLAAIPGKTSSARFPAPIDPRLRTLRRLKP